MSSNPIPPWLEFERLIADMQRQLAPTATVSHADRIVGRSGEVRKIDVSIRQAIGGYPILIVIDCKKRSRPISVNGIEAFCGQVEDVGANLGVVISTRGFTKGALAAAALRGILAQELGDAGLADWQALVGPSAWFSLFKVFLNVRHVIGTSSAGPVPLTLQSIVINGLGGTGRSVEALFWEAWNQSALPRPLGPVRVGLDLNPGPMNVVVNGQQAEIQALEVVGDVTVKRWTVNLHLACGRVLRNADGRPVFGEFESNSFEWAEVMKTQPSVEMTESEYADICAPGRQLVDLGQANRFLRVSITGKAKGEAV